MTGYNSLAAEISQNRKAFVDGFVNGRLARCEGDATTTEIDNWEGIAVKRWTEMYPRLAGMLEAAS